MHAFEQETKQIIEHLKTAVKGIEAVDNPEIVLLKNSIVGDLRRKINALSMQLGLQLEEGNYVPSRPGQPLKKIFGRVITPKDPNNQEAPKPFERKSADDVAAEELQQVADELYKKFLGTPTDDLLDSVTELELRAVAKKAGLPVTDTNPKKINAPYVEQIKKAIQKQITIDQAGQVNGDQSK